MVRHSFGNMGDVRFSVRGTLHTGISAVLHQGDRIIVVTIIFVYFYFNPQLSLTHLDRETLLKTYQLKYVRIKPRYAKDLGHQV